MLDDLIITLLSDFGHYTKAMLENKYLGLKKKKRKKRSGSGNLKKYLKAKVKL